MTPFSKLAKDIEKFSLNTQSPPHKKRKISCDSPYKSPLWFPKGEGENEQLHRVSDFVMPVLQNLGSHDFLGKANLEAAPNRSPYQCPLCFRKIEESSQLSSSSSKASPYKSPLFYPNLRANGEFSVFRLPNPKLGKQEES